MASLSELNQKQILELIRDKKVKGTELETNVRQGLVSLLRVSHTEGQIADALGVSVRTIGRDVKLLKDQSKAALDELTVGAIAADILAMSERYAKAAFRAGNIGTAWAIIKERAQILQSLGYIHRAPQEVKVDVNHTFDDKDDREIDELFRQCIEDEERNRDFAKDTEGSTPLT